MKSPRVVNASPPPPKPLGDLRGGAVNTNLGPSPERGERRRAKAPTFAPNAAAPGGSTSLCLSPTPKATPKPFLASTDRPRSGPPRKPHQGRRLAGRQQANRVLAVGGHGGGVRRPRSTQHPRVSWAPLSGRCPTINSPLGAAPSPTSGRRPQRLRPGAPAHPGSGSAAGTGPPARGTFSSRPTTGVGRSHPETWLCRAGGEGETTAWGRGEGGGNTRINTRAAPAPSARWASQAQPVRWRRRRRRQRLRPRSPAAPGPELASYSPPQTTQNIQLSATVPSLGPPPTGGGGGGLDSSLSSFSTPSLPSLSREKTTTLGPEAAVRHGCPYPGKHLLGDRGTSLKEVILLIGPKTVFFWAPIMKWGLVCAGLADMARPAEKLSTAQSAVLMATGFIWSRYSLVIIPKNWSLFAVNFFVGTAGASQLFRIWRYNQELKANANK